MAVLSNEEIDEVVMLAVFSRFGIAAKVGLEELRGLLARLRLAHKTEASCRSAFSSLHIKPDRTTWSVVYRKSIIPALNLQPTLSHSTAKL